MLGLADSHDGAPTTQAVATFRQLEDEAEQFWRTWKNVKKNTSQT